MSRYLPGFVILAVSLAAAACTGTVVPQSKWEVVGEERLSPASIDVSASEFRFTLSATTVRAGDVSFRIRNDGKGPHEFVIVAFDGERYAMPTAEREPLPPGESDGLRGSLAPGRYQLVCLLVSVLDDEPVSHMELGMSARFDVTP